MITFAGVLLPSYVKVNAIKYTVLPPISTKTQAINGRGGAYDFGVDLGSREIEVDISIIANDENDIMIKARQLSTWLFHEDLKPLIIGDEPDKQYMARISGDTQITEIGRVGQGTLKFFCPSPYAEAINDKVFTYSAGTALPIEITNFGTVEAYPTFDITFTKETEAVTLVSEDAFILVGTPESPSVKKNTSVSRTILSETFRNGTTGWSAGIAVDGSIKGEFYQATGEIWKVKDSNYGQTDTGGWVGPALSKSLSKELTDFDIYMQFGLQDRDGSDNKKSFEQIGRVELYLFDSNNIQIGRISVLDDIKGTDAPKFQGFVGPMYGAKTAVNSYGKKKGVWKKLSWGRMGIKKVGQRYTFFLSRIVDGIMKDTYQKSWIDSTNVIGNRKVARVQVHIGAYNNDEPVSNAYVSHLVVKEINSYNAETETPILFEAGDTLHIDTDKALVMKNGEPIFTELDPSSDFISLKKGINGIHVTPNTLNMSVSFKERWL